MVSRARRSTGPDRTKIIVGVIIVVLLAGAVIGGILYSNAKKNKTEGQVIPALPGTTTYDVRRDGAIVVAGKADAKVTVDIYLDMLCPFCRQFEEQYTGTLAANLAGGSLRVNYHLVTILNERSDPPGYSLDAANAALCAADNNHFTDFVGSLFSAQPAEGARGYDKTQLTSLGTRLGITAPDFATCVGSSRYNADLQSAETATVNTPYLQRDLGNGRKSFTTPTIAVGQQLIDTTDPKWLDKLLAAP